MSDDKSDSPSELRQIDKEVNNSRDKFLEAIESHDGSIGRRLVMEFLRDLSKSHPKRSRITQKQALETQERVTSLNIYASSITDQILLANIAWQSAMASLAMLAIKRTNEAFFSDPSESKLDELQSALVEEAKVAATMLIQVHSESAKILNDNRRILARYVSEALGFDWPQFLNKVFEELEKIGKENNASRAWVEINKLITNLLQNYGDLPEEMAEEAVEDINRAIRILRIIMGKKNIPEHSKSDVMLRLLEELRKQEDRLRELNEVQKNAITHLMKVGKNK